jgi:hypothetical protein
MTSIAAEFETARWQFEDLEAPKEYKDWCPHWTAFVKHYCLAAYRRYNLRILWKCRIEFRNPSGQSNCPLCALLSAGSESPGSNYKVALQYESGHESRMLVFKDSQLFRTSFFQ